MRARNVLGLASIAALNACVVGVEARATRQQAAAPPTAPAVAEPSAATVLRSATGAPSDRVAPKPRGAARTGWVWVDGYHHWDGVAYVWVPGRRERRFAAYAWKR